MPAKLNESPTIAHRIPTHNDTTFVATSHFENQWRVGIFSSEQTFIEMDLIVRISILYLFLLAASRTDSAHDRTFLWYIPVDRAHVWSKLATTVALVT